MGEAFIAFRDDPELRVAIVTGAGERFFSAGWDLKAYAAGDPAEPGDLGPGGLAGLTELFALDKPVIAAVNGYAAGGGFELALACDLVVAVTEARFSLPEVKLGLVADSGGVLRLPRRLPRALAMELLLTGRRRRGPQGAESDRDVLPLSGPSGPHLTPTAPKCAARHASALAAHIHRRSDFGVGTAAIRMVWERKRPRVVALEGVVDTVGCRLPVPTVATGTLDFRAVRPT
jgi:enoyl-CoA hydratase/carnithine racemase